MFVCVMGAILNHRRLIELYGPNAHNLNFPTSEVRAVGSNHPEDDDADDVGQYPKSPCCTQAVADVLLIMCCALHVYMLPYHYRTILVSVSSVRLQRHMTMRDNHHPHGLILNHLMECQVSSESTQGSSFSMRATDPQRPTGPQGR